MNDWVTQPVTDIFFGWGAGLVVGKGAAARGSALRFHSLVGVIVGEATMQVEQTAAGRPAPLIPHQICIVSIYVQYTQLVKLM